MGCKVYPSIRLFPWNIWVTTCGNWTSFGIVNQVSLSWAPHLDFRFGIVNQVSSGIFYCRNPELSVRRLEFVGISLTHLWILPPLPNGSHKVASRLNPTIQLRLSKKHGALGKGCRWTPSDSLILLYIFLPNTTRILTKQIIIFSLYYASLCQIPYLKALLTRPIWTNLVWGNKQNEVLSQVLLPISIRSFKDAVEQSIPKRNLLPGQVRWNWYGAPGSCRAV